jgi:two-component system nitrogen regulation sensor histidine kinase NtrY
MTTREGGTGLGLAIVSKVLEEHGGGIDLNDNPEGRGGRVRLRVPRDTSVAPARDSANHTPPEVAPSAQDEKGAARTAPPTAEI